MDNFFLACDDCALGYQNVRDEARLADEKEFVEYLWSLYKPYADRHFKEDAKKHFQERFWEMYLGVTFLEHRFLLDPHTRKGPEFYVEINNIRCWVEAIAPSAGEGPDAVPEMEYGAKVATSGPVNEIILRLRHAIHEKYKKYQHYLDEGIVGSDEPYILAINSKRIRSIVSASDIPNIVKAVYPFGNLVAVFDRNEATIVDTHYEYRNNIKKKSGADISTDIFLTEEDSGISAVVYSSVDAANYPPKLGADFRLVHNKMADNPIPIGIFQFGVEYWVEKDELKHQQFG
jgi:hypothetical protein